MTILRQFVQNDNGSLTEMIFQNEKESNEYKIPDDRTEVIPIKPRPSGDYIWQNGDWIIRPPSEKDRKKQKAKDLIAKGKVDEALNLVLQML